MSVRSCLLAILTIGPAYGFQLHGELESRTAGRRAVNVGQIYGTLERLVKQAAVESAGSTADGLPLYRITALGQAEALHWLADTESAPGNEWSDLLDRVLIAISLPDPQVLGIDARGIVARYRRRWQSTTETATMDAAATGAERLAGAARAALSAAALDWLRDVDALLEDVHAAGFRHGLNDVRPKRGRRPASVA
ncbi:PadR family transcriptional regulator [Cryobacterium sp. TMT2-17-1]|uniref:PadR family transcriptional regulator n=1 Tax=Cryobacterium sp. TMT2-17-1 TaxID=1259248 RepID=UPI00106D1820|nr:PadR family transcriptional regulator [Cryobacterium sp. TMT2-17-1]TFC54619.1 PadR family transcriptional regulator [Cryobacterium sp. TMT2-17-1]